MTPTVDELLARLNAAARRLEAHATHPGHAGLTDPDPGGTERWEAGQVWAHLAEFPAYWVEQARRVIAAQSDVATPFGRVKTDAGRVEAIERDRRTAPIDLYERSRRGIDEAADALRHLAPDDAERLGVHPTLGVMHVARLFERFVVAHLEEHADQLDLLAQRSTEAPPTTGGITVKPSWPVWSNQREHRVDVQINVLSGSLRVDVDGQTEVKRNGWKMGMSGTEVAFDVDGRPCLLVVRQRYGDTAGPEIDLYSEGRSLTDGTLLESRREAHGREVPNLVRMLLLFIPLIGLPSFLRSQSTASGGGSGPVAWVAVIGAALASAGIGWVLAGRWYGRGNVPHRHLVGGALVAACWLAFFAVFVVVLLIDP